MASTVPQVGQIVDMEQQFDPPLNQPGVDKLKAAMTTSGINSTSGVEGDVQQLIKAVKRQVRWGVGMVVLVQIIGACAFLGLYGWQRTAHPENSINVDVSYPGDSGWSAPSLQIAPNRNNVPRLPQLKPVNANSSRRLLMDSDHDFVEFVANKHETLALIHLVESGVHTFQHHTTEDSAIVEIPSSHHLSEAEKENLQLASMPSDVGPSMMEFVALCDDDDNSEQECTFIFPSPTSSNGGRRLLARRLWWWTAVRFVGSSVAQWAIGKELDNWFR